MTRLETATMSLPELAIEQVLLRLRLPSDVATNAAGDRIAYTEARLDAEVDGRVEVLRVLARAVDGGWIELAALDGHSPCWAPDGTLAFIAGEGIELWSEGGGAHELLVAADAVRELAFSPGGARLAYTCLRAPDTAPDDPIVLREPGYRVDGRPLPPRYHDLRVLDLADGESRTLVSGPFDVVCPAWHPAGDRIAYGRDDLHDSRPALYVVTLDGAETRMTPPPIRAETALWSRDGTQIVFVGQLDRHRGRCGIFRLFALDVASGEVRLLSEELEREVTYTLTFMPGFDPMLAPGGEDVLFTANDDFDIAAYRVSLEGGTCERVLGGRFEAILAGSASESGVVCVMADVRSPGELVVWDPADGARETITELAGDLLADLVEPERREFTAPDGTVVHGLLLRPPGAEGPTPLLLLIHGGPHAAYLGCKDEYDLANWEFVAHGWSVLQLNPRGSTGRSDAFYRGVCGGWGEKDRDDFLSAIDALIAEGLVDGERVGVVGGSYGGFTTNYLLARSDRFKAGVAIASFSDLISHYGTAMRGLHHGEELAGDEPGTGSPVERWELFERLSPIRHAEHVTAPLLLMHGSEDQIVTLGQAEEFFALLRQLGRTAELVIYPGGSHDWLEWPLRHRLDGERRAFQWLTRYVLGDDA